MNRKIIAVILIILVLGVIWYITSQSEQAIPETENIFIDDGTPLENPDADMIDDVNGETGGDFEGIYQ